MSLSQTNEIGLEDGYRSLADVLAAYTEDVEVSGSDSQINGKELVPIPKQPARFDHQLWVKLTEVDDLIPQDLALMVRLAVIRLQDLRKANGYSRSLTGKGGKYWSELCDESRARTNAQKIFGAAKNLERWAKKRAEKQSQKLSISDVLRQYVEAESETKSREKRAKLIEPLFKKMGYASFQSFMAAAHREGFSIKTVKKQLTEK